MSSYIGGKTGLNGGLQNGEGETKVYFLKNLGWVEMEDPPNKSPKENFNLLACFNGMCCLIKDRVIKHVPQF